MQKLLQNIEGEEALENCRYLCLHLKIGRESRKLLFNGNEKRKIEKCRCFKELFSILSKYWDWDEYSILKQITEICESKKAAQEIEKYERKMALYVGLDLIFTQDRNDPPPGYENFVVIINKSYKKLTVRQYRNMKKFIFDNLNVYQYISRPFIHVLFASVHLWWHVKVEAVSCMIKAALERKEIFIKNLFVFMRIGKTVIFDNTQVCCKAVSIYPQ